MTIFCVAERPQFTNEAVDWFASKWGIQREAYEQSFADMIENGGPLPKWFIAVDENDKIIGGCGLIQNDFVDRTDLFPYVCALYVEKPARGQGLGGKLLEFARKEAAKSGFDAVYLCTDHTQYYEKYGWRYLTQGLGDDGNPCRIYTAPVIKELI